MSINDVVAGAECGVHSSGRLWTRGGDQAILDVKEEVDSRGFHREKFVIFIKILSKNMEIYVLNTPFGKILTYWFIGVKKIAKRGYGFLNFQLGRGFANLDEHG